MGTTEHEVTVTFDSTTAPRQVTFTPNSPLGIPTELGRVTFNLEVRGNFEARFPSNPIQWVDSGTLKPIDPPPAATVTRVNDVSASVLIRAKPGEVESFSFYVIVQTQAGRFFGSDPTIVTMLPPGGGQGR